MWYGGPEAGPNFDKIVLRSSADYVFCFCVHIRRVRVCACCARTLEDALGSHALLEGLTAACWSLARLRLYFLALPLVAFFAVLFLAAKTRGPQRQCLSAAGHL